METSTPSIGQSEFTLKDFKYHELSKKAHDTAVANGFWEGKPNISQLLMLVITELAEAVEAHRNSNFCTLTEEAKYPLTTIEGFEEHIKDTFEDEIADTLIRFGDLSVGFGLSTVKRYPIVVENHELWASDWKGIDNIPQIILNLTKQITQIDDNYKSWIRSGKDEFTSISGFAASLHESCVGFLNSVLQLCKDLNIDIQFFMDIKMTYNAQRELKHGKQY